VYSSLHIVQLLTCQTFNVHDEPEDILGWLLKAIQEKDASAPPTAQALEDDNRGAIIAGR
jgi:hypothetical protein